MPWHTLRIDGVSRIWREVARFVVEPIHDDLPMGFGIKILEDQEGRFVGCPEIAIRDAQGTPDGISGMGRSIEEALADTVKALLGTLNDKAKIEPDSIWWDPRF